MYMALKRRGVETVLVRYPRAKVTGFVILFIVLMLLRERSRGSIAFEVAFITRAGASPPSWP